MKENSPKMSSLLTKENIPFFALVGYASWVVYQNMLIHDAINDRTFGINERSVIFNLIPKDQWTQFCRYAYMDKINFYINAASLADFYKWYTGVEAGMDKSKIGQWENNLFLAAKKACG